MLEMTRKMILALLSEDKSVSRAEREAVKDALSGSARDGAKRSYRTYNEREASQMLGVSVPTVQRMKRRGQLNTVLVCGVRRITESSIASVAGA